VLCADDQRRPIAVDDARIALTAADTLSNYENNEVPTVGSSSMDINVGVSEPQKPVSTPLTPRKTELTNKLSYAKNCLARTRVSLWRLRQQNAQSTESSVRQPCVGICQKIDQLPVTMKSFVMNQINAFTVSL
jgi:hypothetical protein